MELHPQAAALPFHHHHHSAHSLGYQSTQHNSHHNDHSNRRYRGYRRRSLSPPSEPESRSKRARLRPRTRSASMSPPSTSSSSNLPDRAAGSSSLVDERPQARHAQSDIFETITHPGAVRINVQGAFIVDEEEPSTPKSEDYEHDPRDIRLPNHTGVVSHIAVDVSVLWGFYPSIVDFVPLHPYPFPSATTLLPPNSQYTLNSTCS